MKKTTKAVVGSMLAVGTVFGIGASVETPQSNEAHAATQPYYNYQGYTSSQSNFILDKNFINALKNDNLTINGYKITENSKNSDKTIKKYDQQFYLASKHKADGVWFDLKDGVVSKSKLLKVYGNPDTKPASSAQGNEYKYNIGGKSVKFLENNGYITKVGIHNGES